MAGQKTAFITGAAMGMGAMKARKLAERGWKVFAGVLPGADTSELGDHENIVVVEQDVTSDKSVTASAKTVAKHLGDAGLDLLINNAGIADKGTGPIEGINMKETRLMFEVNTFGMMRVIQSFLPMIRKAAPHSRIMNFASGAVRANPACSGSYNMSKWAVEGLTNTLRNELAPFGIEVTSIEPGAVKTHMTANAEETTKSIWSDIPQDVKDVYEPHLKETTTTKMVEQINNGNDPDYVTDEVLALLDKKTWKPRYLVGKDVKPLKVMLALMSERGAEKAIQKAVGIPQYKG
ncbi:MAG: SDR family NAD(P)-dependent oxidoreductase [Hyphomonadaceae bacterium]|nr:SDR family NAD(P)-dependent oxidoreductase [Hyphomonadaceae bacterium]